MRDEEEKMFVRALKEGIALTYPWIEAQVERGIVNCELQTVNLKGC